MRALELYSGIGGFAEAFTTHGEVVAAIDHNPLANQVYASNFEHPLAVKNLDSIPLAQLERREADLWWMSPPRASPTPSAAPSAIWRIHAPRASSTSSRPSPWAEPEPSHRSRMGYL
jgi:hypothetical protein